MPQHALTLVKLEYNFWLEYDCLQQASLQHRVYSTFYWVCYYLTLDSLASSPCVLNIYRSREFFFSSLSVFCVDRQRCVQFMSSGRFQNLWKCSFQPQKTCWARKTMVSVNCFSGCNCWLLGSMQTLSYFFWLTVLCSKQLGNPYPFCGVLCREKRGINESVLNSGVLKKTRSSFTLRGCFR